MDVVLTSNKQQYELCDVQFYYSSSSAAMTVVTGATDGAIAGEWASFRIEAREANGAAKIEGGDVFVVTLGHTHPNYHQPLCLQGTCPADAVPGTCGTPCPYILRSPWEIEIVNPHGDGLYIVSYVTTIAGTYSLSIELDGEAVRSSRTYYGVLRTTYYPFSVRVVPGSVVTENTLVFGGGLDHAEVGEAASFMIQARDLHHNNREEGGDMPSFCVDIDGFSADGADDPRCSFCTPCPEGFVRPHPEEPSLQTRDKCVPADDRTVRSARENCETSHCGSICENWNGTYTVTYTATWANEYTVQITRELKTETAGACPFVSNGYVGAPAVDAVCTPHESLAVVRSCANVHDELDNRLPVLIRGEGVDRHLSCGSIRDLHTRCNGMLQWDVAYSEENPGSQCDFNADTQEFGFWLGNTTKSMDGARGADGFAACPVTCALGHMDCSLYTQLTYDLYSLWDVQANSTWAPCRSTEEGYLLNSSAAIQYCPQDLSVRGSWPQGHHGAIGRYVPSSAAADAPCNGSGQRSFVATGTESYCESDGFGFIAADRNHCPVGCTFEYPGQIYPGIPELYYSGIPASNGTAEACAAPGCSYNSTFTRITADFVLQTEVCRFDCNTITKPHTREACESIPGCSYTTETSQCTPFISKNRFTAVWSPAKTSALGSAVSFSGRGQNPGVNAGEVLQVDIHARDQFENEILSKDAADRFSVLLTYQNGSVERSGEAANVDGDSTYNFTLSGLTQAGVYTLTVSLTNEQRRLTGELVSSQFVTISPGVTSAQKSVVSGQDLRNGFVGIWNSFTVEAFDVFGNRAQAGGANFEVLMTREAMDTETDSMHTVTIEDNQEGAYFINYRTVQVGAYRLKVVLCVDISSDLCCSAAAWATPALAVAGACSCCSDCSESPRANCSAVSHATLHDSALIIVSPYMRQQCEDMEVCRCAAGYTGGSVIWGLANGSYIETVECDLDVCNQDERVDAHTCVRCDVGMSAPVGADATGADTSCTTVACPANSNGAGGGKLCICFDAGHAGDIQWSAARNAYTGSCDVLSFKLSLTFSVSMEEISNLTFTETLVFGLADMMQIAPTRIVILALVSGSVIVNFGVHPQYPITNDTNLTESNAESTSAMNAFVQAFNSSTPPTFGFEFVISNFSVTKVAPRGGEEPIVRLCASNERVFDRECIACEAGTYAPTGADATGADTNCTTVVCPPNSHRNNASCVCDAGYAGNVSWIPENNSYADGGCKALLWDVAAPDSDGSNDSDSVEQAGGTGVTPRAGVGPGSRPNATMQSWLNGPWRARLDTQNWAVVIGGAAVAISVVCICSLAVYVVCKSRQQQQKKIVVAQTLVKNKMKRRVAKARAMARIHNIWAVGYQSWNKHDASAKYVVNGGAHSEVGEEVEAVNVPRIKTAQVQPDHERPKKPGKQKKKKKKEKKIPEPGEVVEM